MPYVETADPPKHELNGLGHALDAPIASPRRVEVEARQAAVGSWLHQAGFDVLLVFDPVNVAWFTAGGRFAGDVDGLVDSAFLYITPTARCAIANRQHTARIFAQELDGLGFYVKEMPWTQRAGVVVAELSTARKVASDRIFAGLADGATEMRRLRKTLSEFDKQRYRMLARQICHAAEATCRTLIRGQSELEIAGHLCHRLMKHGIEPQALHVFADDRCDKFTRPLATHEPVRDFCTMMVTGRQGGLSFTTSRAVAFGALPEVQRQRYRTAAIASATMLRYARSGETVARLFALLKAVYHSQNHEFAWHDAPLGGLTGYGTTIELFTPDSPESLATDQVARLTPLVGGFVCADCAIVGVQRGESLCSVEDWPVLSVVIGAEAIDRPDILMRPTE